MAKSSATVPLHLEHDRPFADFALTQPAGGSRIARLWVDTGGGSVILSEPLARELGLLAGPSAGGELVPIDAPRIALDDMPLDLSRSETFADVGKRTLADGIIGGQVLARYHVSFDYPGRTLTLAQPGSLEPRGTPVPATIHDRSGFPQIEVEVDGESYGMLLDTGASFTMISRALLERWATRHPAWPRAVGAVGRANMGRRDVDAAALMLRLPELTWGPFRLPEVAAVSRPPGTFEQMLTQYMTGPIVGALAGNILKVFRVEIDYRAGLVSLQQQAPPDPHDLDLVGVTLEQSPDGAYVIAAVNDRVDRAERESVRDGDRLLAIDNRQIGGSPLAGVVDLLRGRPGERRALLLERGGNLITVQLPVLRVL